MVTKRAVAGKAGAQRKARTASEAIADQIRSRVASGELQPGDMLPSERVLLETYGVAQPTMRGALRILESDGLISIERGTRGGARVIVPDLAPLARRIGLHLQLRGTDLRELIEAQLVIQPPAAGFAAQNRTDTDLIRLRAAVQRCRAANSLSDFLAAVNEFGNAVLSASHNRVLTLYGELTTNLLAESLDHYVAVVDVTFDQVKPAGRRMTSAFAELVDLVEAGDSERAEEFWRERLYRVGTVPWPAPSPFEIYARPPRTSRSRKSARAASGTTA